MSGAPAEEKKKKKGKKKIEDPMQKTREQEEAEIAALKADIEEEQKKHDNMTWNNNELEKTVRQMVRKCTVISWTIFNVHLFKTIFSIRNCSMSNSVDLVMMGCTNMFDMCLFEAKNRVSEFDSFESILWSKIMFDPSLTTVCHSKGLYAL